MDVHACVHVTLHVKPKPVFGIMYFELPARQELIQGER
jgi:hypothetical protein